MHGLPTAFDAARSFVVIAPHPDDDVLGCGALIARAAPHVPVKVVYVTDGAASHRGSRRFPPQRLRALREREARRALTRLGVAQPPRFLRWPDGSVPRAEDRRAHRIVAALRACIPESERVVIAVPWRRDPHPDHRAVAELVAVALRTRPRATRLEYSVWLNVRGEDGDAPRPAEGARIVVDSRPWIGRKRAALREHRSQLGGLITDAPEAFALPETLIARALEPVERFIVTDRV